MSILGMNDVKENMINSTKLVGLVKAKKAGTLVPEFIYLSEDEYKNLKLPTSNQGTNP